MTPSEHAKKAAEAVALSQNVVPNNGPWGGWIEAAIQSALTPLFAQCQREARRDALEEAAKACACLAADVVWNDAPDDCYHRAADVIRGLKGAERAMQAQQEAE